MSVTNLEVVSSREDVASNSKQRWYRTRHPVLALVALCVFVLKIFYVSFNTNFRIQATTSASNQQHLELKSKRNCDFPKSLPFDPSMKPFLHERKEINCAKTANSIGKIGFLQERGQRLLRKVENLENCCYRQIRITGSADNKCIPIMKNATSIQIPKSEKYTFIEVICRGKHSYRDGFAFVDDDEEKSDAVTPEEQLRVIVLGLDNTSRMHFLRSLPKSNEYLSNNLSAIVMKGYTKVADNSLPNLIPVLTGKTYHEFTKICANSSEAHLDDCDFIWKDFSTEGYKTGYAEDAIGIATFNLNWEKPFNKTPTDFYLLPFSSFMERHLGSSDKICYGTRLSFKMLLDNIENTAVALKNRPYFHFTWTTKLSHDDFNKLSLGDASLLNFLQFMDKSGQLNRSALIILGDHGNRAPEEAQLNKQGKIEVRMPVLYIVLPRWFKGKYPLAFKNLQDNSAKLTSPFDVYETLKVFMNLSQLQKPDNNFTRALHEGRNPISLFQKIPDARSCLEAGVSLHWCVCRGARDERPALITTGDVKNVVKTSVDFMNTVLKPVADKCEVLELNEIVAAYHIDYGTTIGPKYSGVSKALRVYFKTTPGLGYFTGTAVQVKDKGNWTMVDEVIRLDHYGSQSWCVTQEYRFYCLCRKSYT